MEFIFGSSMGWKKALRYSHKKVNKMSSRHGESNVSLISFSSFYLCNYWTRDTNSSPLKIGRGQKGKWSVDHHFSKVMFVLGSVHYRIAANACDKITLTLWVKHGQMSKLIEGASPTDRVCWFILPF